LELTFFEAFLNLFHPDLNPFMLVGITFLELFQKTLYQFTSRRKDGQTDYDEKYPLKNWKKQAKDPQNNEEPANDQNTNSLDVIHSVNPLYNISISACTW
jgi:hypothetical protein